MDKVTVSKERLLEVLRTNRNDHADIYQEALDGFATKLEERIQKLRDDYAAGVKTLYLQIARPESHLKQYDRAIAMLEMTVDDLITLSERDFARYVMDDWVWQAQFLSNAFGSRTAVGKFSDVYAVGTGDE